MVKLNEEYILDGAGNKKSVVIPFNQWEKVLEQLEELDDIRAYDDAKTDASDPIPFKRS